MFGDKKTRSQSFDDYLKAYNLLDNKNEPKRTKQEREQRKQQALSKASKIIELDEKRKVNKSG